jgi:hypothetical protein
LASSVPVIRVPRAANAACSLLTSTPLSCIVACAVRRAASIRDERRRAVQVDLGDGEIEINQRVPQVGDCG